MRSHCAIACIANARARSSQRGSPAALEQLQQRVTVAGSPVAQPSAFCQRARDPRQFGSRGQQFVEARIGKAGQAGHHPRRAVTPLHEHLGRRVGRRNFRYPIGERAVAKRRGVSGLDDSVRPLRPRGGRQQRAAADHRARIAGEAVARTGHLLLSSPQGLRPEAARRLRPQAGTRSIARPHRRGTVRPSALRRSIRAS